MSTASGMVVAEDQDIKAQVPFVKASLLATYSLQDEMIGGRRDVSSMYGDHSNYTTVVSAMEAPPPPVALREDNVPDDLICSICMTVPTEPLLTPCDHLFCRTCIHQALGNQNLCPIDRQPCSPHQLKQLDGLLSRVWGGIQVKCGCHESGCIWTGSIADYGAHLENCSVYSNSNSALRREIARLKEQLEEKDEEITSLQTRLNEALRNNERNELRYRSTQDELNATREKLNAAERRMRRMTESLQDATGKMLASTPAHSPLAAALIYKHGKTHAQLVDHYTTYYRLWNAEAEAAKRECDAAALYGQLNSDAHNRKQWAEHYSSSSVSLVHYHSAISNGGAEPYQRPQSPPMPPGF